MGTGQEKKKSICMILPGKLPIPNIRGGAIETLITILLNQNEIYGGVYFIIVSAWAEGVEKAAAKYKNAEFHYVKIRNGLVKKTINFINYLIAVTAGNIDFFKTPFHCDIEKVICGINADAVVVEHGVYKHFEFLRKYYSREQLYLHLHGTGPMPDRRTRETFGHVITVSEFVKYLYVDGFRNYHTKFHVCLNGIDDVNFSKRITREERLEIRKKFGVLETDLLILYCGRLVHEKGVKELIKGVLETRNENIKLLIIGSSNFQDGRTTDYVKKLKGMIQGHEKQIFFTGYVPNDQLYKYYQSADMQTVCSICEEAGSLVNVEGMMSGLPLIVTDSGAISEYTDENCCDVIHKYNSLNSEKDGERVSKQLTEKFNYYYNHRDQLDKKQIYSRECAENFTGSRFYRRFVGIFVDHFSDGESL